MNGVCNLFRRAGAPHRGGINHFLNTFIFIIEWNYTGRNGINSDVRRERFREGAE